jgi:hypothetical protein
MSSLSLDQTYQPKAGPPFGREAKNSKVKTTRKNIKD